MTASETEVCFYWTAVGSKKCSLNITGGKKNTPTKIFFFFFNQTLAEEFDRMKQKSRRKEQRKKRTEEKGRKWTRGEVNWK